jgi:hypothetical protein
MLPERGASVDWLFLSADVARMARRQFTANAIISKQAIIRLTADHWDLYTNARPIWPCADTGFC